MRTPEEFNWMNRIVAAQECSEGAKESKIELFS